MEPLNFPSLPESTETDWQYVMRRQMQEILPGLYLGPYAAANKSQLETLKQVGITHIVCIRLPNDLVFVRPNFPNDFRYLVLEIADSESENIIKHFPKVKAFLDSCFDLHGKALVHGSSGISRSAALVIAYIMEKYGCSYQQAFECVHRKRFCIRPNEGFTQQLIEFEPMYKARLQIEAMPSTSLNGLSSQLKRKLHDVDDVVCDMDH
jgi:serine/threonine/tyrosine-interacting protein